MDSAPLLRGRSSIPAVDSKNCLIKWSISLSGITVRKKMNPDTLKWCSSVLNKQFNKIKQKILATPFVGEHGNKCEVWDEKNCTYFSQEKKQSPQLIHLHSSMPTKILIRKWQILNQSNLTSLFHFRLSIGETPCLFFRSTLHPLSVKAFPSTVFL